VKELIEANIAVLHRCERLLQNMDDDAYRYELDAVFQSSIGSQVRHCLDHYDCFLRAIDSGCVDYEARSRDPLLESDRRFAIRETRRICAALAPLGALTGDAQLQQQGSAVGGRALAPTSLGRELDFLLGHTVHHCALLAIMCRELAIPVEPGFGVADSTRRHRADLSKVASR
jgi:uncharacterized damage-inducible protein DinB